MRWRYWSKRISSISRTESSDDWHFCVVAIVADALV